MIILEGMPFPPSSNSQYVSFAVRNRIIHKPSLEYNLFKKDMRDWALKNAVVLNMAKLTMKEWKKKGLLFEAQVQILAPEDKLYTKEGKPRKWDVSNRLKALMDITCEWLAFDDSEYWAFRAEKVASPIPSSTLTIEPFELKPNT